MFAMSRIGGRRKMLYDLLHCLTSVTARIVSPFTICSVPLILLDFPVNVNRGLRTNRHLHDHAATSLPHTWCRNTEDPEGYPIYRDRG